MRELQLWEASEGFEGTFDDIVRLAADCHFSDCRHDAEPRCAVKQAVGEGRLAPERLASYHKLQAELAVLATRQDALARQGEKKKLRAIHRAVRRMPDKRQS